jgi:DNA-binding NtrC family response regulator
MYGYSATIVDSGFKAIELAKKMHFNIVLSDINMPGINGIETFKEIKKISPTTIVIMMTAAVNDGLIKEAVDEGCFAIVNKPYEMDKLIDTIDRALKKTIVLVVDDDSSIREVLCDSLEIKGHKTVSVGGGEEALEIFKNGSADIALIDIKMPGMNGFETVEQIKKICPEIGVVMITAYPQEDYQRRSLMSGAYTCLNKPLDMEGVFKIVNEIREKQIIERSLNILLIEDDDSLSQTLSGILKKEGYLVDCAKTGQAAIDKNKESYYTACLVDYKLPDMTGIDVVKKVKEINPETNIIFMSGYATLEVAIEAIREDVKDFLTKPVNPDEIIKSLRKIPK